MEAISRLYFTKVQNRNYLGVWTKGTTYNPLDFQVHSFYGHHSTSANAQGYTYRQLHVYTNTKELHLPLYIVQSFNGVTVDWGDPENPTDTSGDTDGTVQNSILESLIAALKA